MEKNNDDNTVINDDQNVEVKLENSTLETASQPTISKNQLKRLRRDEYLKSKKKQKKEFEKLKKHAGKLSKGDISPTENEAKIPVITKTEDQIVNRQQKREDEISEFLERCNKNFSVIIDCSWESNHSESALRSLSQQIMFCYSCNKRSSKPCNIILSGVGPLLKAKFEKLHYDNWIGITTFFTDVLTDSCDPSINPLLPPKNKIVYLTSDSDEIIERLDPSDCYVIGGIVDRNSLKGATYKKAKELGIRTAKLPIKEHFELSATHILTVFRILITSFSLFTFLCFYILREIYRSNRFFSFR